MPRSFLNMYLARFRGVREKNQLTLSMPLRFHKDEQSNISRYNDFFL
jgi:hypothetical protein